MSKQTTKNTQIRLWDLPQGLIQRGKDMADRGHDIWLAGLGAVAAAEEEGSAFFDNLVLRGQKVEEAGKKQVDSVRKEIAGRREDLRDSVGENVYEPLMDALQRFGVSTRSEVRDLAAKVNELTRRIDAFTARPQREGTAPVQGGVVYYVVAREEGDGWVIRKEGRESAVSLHPTKDEAVEQARALASQHQPSRLAVYKKDGSLQDTFTYAG